jgi:hypothetical protein
LSKALRYSIATDFRCSSVIVCLANAIVSTPPEQIDPPEIAFRRRDFSTGQGEAAADRSAISELVKSLFASTLALLRERTAGARPS